VAAVILWIAAGGHVGLTEFANLLLGHFLYGAVVVGFALVAAALADSSATAAIIALAVTLGFWVLDFAAAGDSGLVKSLSSLSLTNLLRTFERGIFSLGSVLGALAASAGLTIVTGFLINAKVTGARKLLLSMLTLLAAGGLVAGTSQLRVYADASQDQRNSFAPADVSTLSELGQRLVIVVRLAPEDPRYVDFERNVLDKLQRILPDVKVVLESQSRTGAFEESSQQYGTVLYRYGGKQAASRSTGTGEILPLLYGLAGVERKVVAPTPAYPGYPLEASPRAAEIFFYGVLPVLIMVAWAAAQGLIGPGRAQSGVRSRDTFAVGGQSDGKGDAT